MHEQNKRRTQITIETHSITIIRTNGKSPTTFCDCCQTNVAVFAPEQIAAFLRLTLTEVCRRIETNELHLIDTQRRIALICGGSLNNTTKTEF
jgi:hypothetical protein